MRRTYQQRRWPNTPLFQSVAKKWCKNQSSQLLGMVWHAIDAMCETDLEKVPMSDSDEAKEESLNLMLSVRIDKLKSGDEPFAVVHQPPEQNKRKTKNARSPAPDIGFVWHENPNCVWPIEGKILKSAEDLGEYEKEITDNFLSGRYATFSTEGAMLGYLLSGDSEQTLKNVAKKIRKRLRTHPEFENRNHKISKHIRSGVDDRKKETFFCHHMAVAVY